MTLNKCRVFNNSFLFGETTMNENWRRRVYRKSKAMKRSKQKAWQALRHEILNRDEFTCYRCEKYIANGRGLEVHHILPRDQGGQDYTDNLITLCFKCHDHVEINKILTLEQIRFSYEDGEIEEVKVKALGIREDSFVRPDWHAWVYGGMQRPESCTCENQTIKSNLNHENV